ncbi:MAG: 30S ribosomal protein S6 [Micrococcaceae bacterium]
MRPYEMMILIDPDIEEKSIEKSVKKYTDVIKKDGGTVENVDIWGRRKLAYDIQKKSEANYVVVNFTAEAKTAAEVDRQLGIDESIMRVKIIRPDEQ